MREREGGGRGGSTRATTIGRNGASSNSATQQARRHEHGCDSAEVTTTSAKAQCGNHERYGDCNGHGDNGVGAT
jgi:hypothetical protein